MESNRRIDGRGLIQISQNHLPKLLAIGLMLSAILIIFSVEYYYQNGLYLELAVSTGLFVSALIMIRWLNAKRN